MLQAIRDKAKGWIAWVIVILLSIPFALFGIHQFFEGGSGAAIAEVNGEEIPLTRYSREYQQALAAITQQRERATPLTQEEENWLKIQVLNGIINRYLVTRTVEDEGYATSEEQLRSAVQNDPRFQTEDTYSKDMLMSYLRYEGLSEAGFATREKQRLSLIQLETGIQASAFLTKNQVDEFLRISDQTRDFDQITLQSESFMQDVSLEDGAIEKYYQDNKETFLSPERIRVEYLDLDAEKLARNKDLDPDEIRGWYEDDKERYKTPPSYHAAHILITVPSDADEPTREQARETIHDLESRVRAGEDFAALAKAHSMDTGTAENGGDLGFVKEGELEEAVYSALGQLQPGELAKPVRSTFGWHLVKLIEAQGGEVKPLEEIQDEVEAAYRADLGERRFFELGETLANTTYEFPESLQPAADALGLPVESSVWFHADGPVDPAPDNDSTASEANLARLESFRGAAFSEDVLNDGVNSQVIPIGEHRAVVLRILERKPSRPLSLDEVRDRIKTQLLREKAIQAATDKAEEIRAAIESGSDPKTAAETAGARFQSYTRGKRSDFDLPNAVLRGVFRLPKPTDDKPVVSSVSGDTGERYVVVLKKVHQVDSSQSFKEDADLLRKSMDNVHGGWEFQAYVDHLRETADIEIFGENL